MTVYKTLGDSPRSDTVKSLGDVAQQSVTGVIATQPEHAMQTITSTPETQNQVWGFWGTMGDHAPAAWPLAINAITQATGEDEDAARIFLDSRHGRHFADEVHNALYDGHTLPDAIQAATAKWMAWNIDKSTSSHYGIPKRMPYLAGFVSLLAQAAED